MSEQISNNISANNKRIAKNTIILYFRMLFLLGVSLYTSRIVLEALGVVDYGIYNVVGGFVAMFGIISSTLTGACSRFINYEMGTGNMDRLKAVFSTTVTIQVILALIVAVVCESFGLWYINNVMVIPGDRLIAANWCFQFSVINFFISLVSVPYNAAIVAHEKMSAFAYISIFEGISRLLICYLIIVLPYDNLIAYGFLLLLIQIIVRLIYQGYCRIHFEESRYFFVWNKQLIKEIFSYSSWNLIGNTSGILKNQGINILLNYFFGPVVNAAKGVSNQVNNAINGFVSNFMMALNPQITQSYSSGNRSNMMILINYGSRFSFYILILFALPIIFNADYVLSIWLKEVPDYAVSFSVLTLIAAIICSLSKTLITAQNATGKVKNYQIVVGGIQIAIVPISLIVLKLGGSPISVMWLLIFDEVISLFARIYMLSKNIEEFSSKRYCKDVIFNCLSVLLCSSIAPIILQFYKQCGFIYFIFNVAIVILMTVASILFVGCTQTERLFIYSKLKARIKRK